MVPSEQRPELHPRPRIVTEKCRRGVSNLLQAQIPAISDWLVPN